ncbi:MULTISPECIES: hypothetical protein [unclassified Sinorhizobium]|uniref:hypothetical protein n=1 Tax=unclassified Sinorhizobium TaxID=2613772 RepID=UPI003524F147
MRKFTLAAGLAFCLTSLDLNTQALAALENNFDYNAIPQPDVSYAEYKDPALTEPPMECHPTYAPAFIRANDGTIIGVGYLELSEDCGP